MLAQRRNDPVIEATGSRPRRVGQCV